MRRLVGHSETVRKVVYQPKLNTLLSGSNDNTLIVWDVEENTIAHQYRHPADVIDISVSEDGGRILSLANDDVYRLWERESLAELINRIQATFTLRELTCIEREQYNILPLCS